MYESIQISKKKKLQFTILINRPFFFLELYLEIESCIFRVDYFSHLFHDFKVISCIRKEERGGILYAKMLNRIDNERNVEIIRTGIKLY